MKLSLTIPEGMWQLLKMACNSEGPVSASFDVYEDNFLSFKLLNSVYNSYLRNSKLIYAGKH